MNKGGERIEIFQSGNEGDALVIPVNNQTRIHIRSGEKTYLIGLKDGKLDVITTEMLVMRIVDRNWIEIDNSI